jgi:hypothetical protein
MQAPLLAKEEIPGRHFKKQEVLKDLWSITLRREDLEKAMRIGNNDHGKVKLVFETTDGIYQVETTVWSVTQNNVMLKSNAIIPICCIHQVTFFE